MMIGLEKAIIDAALEGYRVSIERTNEEKSIRVEVTLLTDADKPKWFVNIHESVIEAEPELIVEAIGICRRKIVQHYRDRIRQAQELRRKQEAFAQAQLTQGIECSDRLPHLYSA